MHCVVCEEKLQPEFLEDDTDYQFDNALWIGFFGGYGMFVESREMLDHDSDAASVLTGATYEAIICHDCAHSLCKREPWLESLLKPETGHAHKKSYLEQNPEHIGWDNKPKGNSHG